MLTCVFLNREIIFGMQTKMWAACGTVGRNAEKQNGVVRQAWGGTEQPWAHGLECGSCLFPVAGNTHYEVGRRKISELRVAQRNHWVPFLF